MGRRVGGEEAKGVKTTGREKGEKSTSDGLTRLNGFRLK